VLATKIENDPMALRKNFSLEFDETGLVKNVVEKPKKVKNKIKGCGMYLFDDNIFEAVNKTPRTALRNEYEITDAIQIFIDLGYKVYYTNIIEEDVNITFPHDLFNINMEFLRIHNKDRIFGEHVVLGNNIHLENVIVGENSVIEDHVRLKNVITLPGAHIKDGRTIENSIVTPNFITRIQ
jgi:dTDP-glucose pyrophosphorylase